MSTMVAELYDALRAAGVTDDKARAAVVGVDAQNGLASKHDLMQLRSEFEQLRTQLRAEMTELRTQLRSEMAELRTSVQADMAKLEARLIRWVVGTIIAMTAIFAAIVKLL